MKVPSIGRTVHFVEYDRNMPGEDGDYAFVHRMATVLVAGEAQGTIPCLGVWTPMGTREYFDVAYDEGATHQRSWHWPEYVPETTDGET